MALPLPNASDDRHRRGRRFNTKINMETTQNPNTERGDVRSIDCSAFMLVKRGPDGRDSNHRFDSEMDMAQHLIAMWKYTPGYSVVAIFRLPNVGGEP